MKQNCLAFFATSTLTFLQLRQEAQGQVETDEAVPKYVMGAMMG